MTIMLAQLCYLITLFSAPGTPPQIQHVSCPIVSPSPTPSPTNVPTSIPTFTPSASPIPTLAPTATPTAPPTVKPTAPPTLTPTPVPTQTPISTTPAALLCVHFAKNPICSALPATKAIAPSSSSWAALEFASGHDALGALQISNAANPYLDNWDGSEPRYELPVGASYTQQTLSCDKASWSNWLCGTTGMNGKVVTIPVGAIPEGDADHHLSWDDYALGGEVDLWESDMPGGGVTLHVGGAGFCAWGTDGTGCSGSTATGLATSLGGIDPVLLKAAEASPNGTLPFALSAGALCDDESSVFVYPAKSSDGSNSDFAPACAGHTGAGQRPPEGTRWFLAMHDADINATNNAPYVKVILRTLDEDHFGAVVTDTNWNYAPEGFNLQFNRGDYGFAAAEAGIQYGTDVFLPITTNGINLPGVVTFCSSGTC